MESSFERDLGFDSLTRMELLHRAEREFAANLPEQVLAEIETPRDLLREIDAAAGRPAAIARTSDETRVPRTGARAPANAKTLTEALAWHAREHPDRLHVRFYDDTSDGETLSYGELWEDAGHVAAGLIALDVTPGEAVVIMLPSAMAHRLSPRDTGRHSCSSAEAERVSLEGGATFLPSPIPCRPLTALRVQGPPCLFLILATTQTENAQRCV